MNNKDINKQKLVLEKMRRDFVANVSHELRTPLTVVHGYLEVLLEQNIATDNEIKKIFTQMYQQTTRMENIIEDLLLLSRLESDKQEEVSHVKVNIAVLIKAVCEEAKTLSGASKHNFHLDIDPELEIFGDKQELQSLISNLVFNAVKYTPTGGHIYVSWYRADNKACFQVRDTGIGIEKKYIHRLTERFYRVDKARSRASGGTGLGLAIVKHVLIRHQAELEIVSELNMGSTFSCLFPLIKT